MLRPIFCRLSVLDIAVRASTCTATCMRVDLEPRLLTSHGTGEIAEVSLRNWRMRKRPQERSRAKLTKAYSTLESRNVPQDLRRYVEAGVRARIRARTISGHSSALIWSAPNMLANGCTDISCVQYDSSAYVLQLPRLASLLKSVHTGWFSTRDGLVCALRPLVV